MHKPLILPVIFVALSVPSAMALSNGTNSTSTAPATANQKQSDQKQNDQSKMSPFQIILRDHDYIVHLMADLNRSLTANANIDESRAKFKTLKDYVVKHETMEQKVWYPELKKHEALTPIITNLEKEESTASTEINKIDGIKDNTEWVSKVRQLMQAIAQHASDEETKLFPKVKNELKPAELDAIADKMKEYQSKNDMAVNDSQK